MNAAARVREYALTTGTLGASSAQTVVVVLLPLVLARYAPSAFWIGMAVAAEGLFALIIPYWTGTLSDRLPDATGRRLGRRAIFLLLAAPVMAAALIIAPFLQNFWAIAAVLVVFFAAAQVYQTPLWALLVDAVPDARRGRVHGVRGALHAGGLAYGLVAGGILFTLWEPLPFFIAAALVLATTFVTVRAIPVKLRSQRIAAPLPERPAGLRELLAPPAIRWFLVANALWTGAIDGLRPYVFLFATIVLGVSAAEASLALGALVVGLALGAVLIGHAGDRWSRSGLLQAGAILTGVALLAGTFVRDIGPALAMLACAGVGAAALVALPYPLYARLIDERSAGRYTGLYVFSLGVARLVTPPLIGLAIDLGARLDPSLEGYPFLWPVAGTLALLSAWALRRSEGARGWLAPRRAAALLLLATAVAACAPLARSGPRAPVPTGAVTDHVLVISLDGLRPEAIDAFGLRTLQRLRSEGSWTGLAQTVIPSTTLPSHTSMLTGVTPEVHGIAWNRDLTSTRGHVAVPTIFGLARAHGFITAGFFSKPKFRHLQVPGTLDYTQAPRRPEAWLATRTVEDVVDYLRHEQPNLLFVHLAETDYAGHAFGWMTTVYGWGARRLDGAVGTLLRAADGAWGPGEYTVIVTSDHGGHGRRHGTADPRDTTIPWIAWGKGVEPGELQPAVRTMDTGATVLWLLGVDAPAAPWNGRAVTSAFTAAARAAAAAGIGGVR